MIMPMKKVCLMVQDKSCDDALKKLRGAGVFHIEKDDVPIDVNSNALKLKIKVEDAFGIIADYKAPKKKKITEDERKGRERRQKPVGMRRGRRSTDIHGSDSEAPYSLDAVRAKERPFLPDLMIGFGEQRKTFKEKDSFYNREITRIENWGDFDPSSVREIIEYGVPVFLYELSTEDYEKLDKDVCFIKIKDEKTSVRIIVFYNPLPGIAPFALPDKPIGELKQEMAKNKVDLDAMEAKIKSFADRRPALNNDMMRIQQDIEFETAMAGMTKVSDVPQGYELSWLTGYIPACDFERVKTVAKDNNWALSAYDPGPDDTPPTKIENNAFVRMINPLFSFLGTIPGYREFDISPSYLLFFSIFVAMIVGDAGYGLMLFSVAAIAALSFKRKKKPVPDIINLLMLLTGCTVVWGTINGSWFQIPSSHLPVFLKVLILPPFNNTGPLVEFPSFLQDIFKLPESVPVDKFKTNWCIQFLCFTFALIQLGWARGKRVIYMLPKLSAFAQLGTLVMLVGLYFLVLSMLLKIEFPSFALPLIITGVALNLIFAEQNGGNFFLNVLKGLSGFFSLFLKIVGCFADIISYIRLFAVGLAGATIAQIFNDMAVGGGFGNFGLLFILRVFSAILILAVCHGLNLVLTALSVLVHGVRLNLLEYAGNHLEMEWSGYLYKPFAVKQKR